MDIHKQNRLLNNYFNHQQHNVPFKNNALLQNNVMFRNSVSNNNNSQQMRHIQYLQQQMHNINNAKDVSELDKISDGIMTISKENLISSIIRPIKIMKSSDEQHEIDTKYNDAKNTFVKQRETFWVNRTNQPYKNIMKNEDYKKKFKVQDDLIVHKVTDADKLQEVLFNKLDELKNEIEMHDNKLKSIYSLSEKTKHLKKFDYDHVKKYERIKYDPAEYNDLKMDRMEILKREQKKMEGDKKKIDDVLNDLINKGFIDQVQKELLDENEKDDKKESMDDVINKTKNDDIFKEIEDELINEPQNNKSVKTKTTTKPKTIIKATVKTKQKNNTPPENKQTKNATSVSNDTKDKYRNRQKK